MNVRRKQKTQKTLLSCDKPTFFYSLFIHANVFDCKGKMALSMCVRVRVLFFCFCFCFLYFPLLAQPCNYRELQVIYYLAGDGSCSKLFFQIHFHDYTSLSENTVWLLFSFQTLFSYLLLCSAVDDDAVDVRPAP